MLFTSTEPCGLSGKVAVVTGSTQGLGEEIARLFAARGLAGLVICGRQRVRGEAVAASISATGCKTVFVPADLQHVDDCRAVIAAADQHFGGLDILVNSAGLTDRGTILDTSEELYDLLMAVNLRAPFFLTQEAARLMIRSQPQGLDHQYHIRVRPWRAELHQRLLHQQGWADHADQEHCHSLMRNNIRVNGLTIGWMDTPGEDRIMKTYHGAADGWKEKAEAAVPWADC